MSKTEKLNEEQIFKQEVSDDELEAAVGGRHRPGEKGKAFWWDDDPNNCTENHWRQIYSGGFPNCAASVEDGSWCGTNDACNAEAVNYQGMDDCIKAHA